MKESNTKKLPSLLVSRNLSIAVAESCTGGNIAHEITLQPGSSTYFIGGVVSYANAIKVNVLGVKVQDIEKYGVVSEPIAMQMAYGIRELMKTDVAISTTGVAGPDGGSEENPVGAVWIGVSSKIRTWAKRFQFDGARNEIIDSASKMAMEMVTNEVLELDSKLNKK